MISKAKLMSGLLLFLTLSSTGVAASAKNKTSNAKKNGNVVTVYLARHGQTTGNVLTLNEGWDDYPLTPQGDSVAKQVGAGLRGVHFTEAACGKLVRHLDTIKDMLDYSGNNKITVLETPQFREVGGGKYELYQEKDHSKVIDDYYGVKDNAELSKKFGLNTTAKRIQAIYELDKKNDSIPVQDRAESANQVLNREAAGIKRVAKLTKNKNGKNALVVSSGYVIAAYLSKYDHNLSKTDKSLLTNGLIPNSGVTKVYYNVKTGKVTFGKVGDLSHVQKGAKYLQSHKVKESDSMKVDYEK